MKKINQGQVKFYNQHGEGVVFVENKPFYVYGTILGEVVEFEVINELKTYGIGRLLNIIERSSNRVDHNIQNAHLIGGYDLIHMNNEEQKNFKINKVINDFKKIAKIELNDVEWFQGEKRFKYRNKITLHDGYFYQKNSNQIIDIDDFLLSDIIWDKNKKGTIIYRKLDTLICGTKNDKLYTTDNMCDFNFRIGLNSFYQVNKEVASFAYKMIQDYVLENKKTLDLYSGIGTITIIASKKSSSIIGVEINKNSFQDALYNKKLNNVDNVKFINKDVNEFIKNNQDYFDTIILDPAREGVGKKTMKKILEMAPSRIIYMSCNPGTQAADISYIKEKYKIVKVVVMDMFPQTYHIESLIVLDLI